jgi:hypothetical protein
MSVDAVVRIRSIGGAVARVREETDWPREDPVQKTRRQRTAATPQRERGAADVYGAIASHRPVAEVARARSLTARMDTARHAAQIARRSRAKRGSR